MPIYEYRCAACGFQSEYLRKVTDPNLAVCPECGKDTFKKLLTAAGFQLKGSGWYATDFKNSGAKPAEPKRDGDTKKKDADAKPGATPSRARTPSRAWTRSRAKHRSQPPARSRPRRRRPAGQAAPRLPNHGPTRDLAGGAREPRFAGDP